MVRDTAVEEGNVGKAGEAGMLGRRDRTPYGQSMRGPAGSAVTGCLTEGGFMWEIPGMSAC